MQRYDAMRAPEPAEWLELDEQERIILIERFHRKERDDSPLRHVVRDLDLPPRDQRVP